MGHTIGRTGETARASVCSECVQSCPACGGSALKLVRDGEGFDTLVKCGAQRALWQVECYNGAKLPAHFAGKTLAGFIAENESQNRVKSKLLSYQSSFTAAAGRGFVLIGEPGVGKTHLMTSILSHITLNMGIRCRYVDFFDLTAQIRSSYSEGNSIDESDLLEPLVKVPVLAIDEMGKGRGSEWELSIIDQLISRRYNAGRVVLASTNFFPKGVSTQAPGLRPRLSLEERVTPRIYSRLRAMCEFEMVSGRDHRTGPASRS